MLGTPAAIFLFEPKAIEAGGLVYIEKPKQCGNSYYVDFQGFQRKPKQTNETYPVTYMQLPDFTLTKSSILNSPIITINHQ